MAMGRGSYVRVFLLAFLFICFSSNLVASTTHVVGGSKGWSLSVSYEDWARGRNFATGDTLVFNCPSGQHNVVPVSAAGFRSCKASASASKAAATGNNKFNLKKGDNFFICSFAGHCEAGMKIQVNAS